MILRNLLVALALLWSAPADAAARFAVCTATCTWDNSSTAMWSTSTGGATGASAPGNADTVTLDGATCVGGVTCTITVNANLDISSLTTSACTASTTGCILDFSANDNNVNIGTTTAPATAITNSGSGNRTINWGDGTWTLDATTNIINQAVVTNYTQNANASTIVVVARANSSRGFLGGGKVFNNLTVNTAANSRVALNSGANTFATVTLNAPIIFQGLAATTQTITTLTVSGSSSTAPVLFESTAVGSAATWAITNGLSCSWCVLHDSTFSGGAASATNSLNFGNTSGITITPPSVGGSISHIIGG